MSLLFATPLGALAATSNQANSKANANQPKFELVIQGIQGKALENVRTRLKSKQSNIYADQPDSVRWRFYAETATDIKEAMLPYGYFRAKVKTHLERIGPIWRITADITPGQRLKFTRINVKVTGPGAQDPTFKNYLAHLPIQVGGNFNSEHYERAKDKLQDIANARGYFKAKFIEKRLRVDLQAYTSDVVITFDTGPRYRFGETKFSATPFDETLLRSYLEYSPSDPYLNKKLEQSRSNLAGSNYFQQVVMTPEVKQAHDFLVPVKTTLTTQDQVVYSLGAGYGNVTGPRALATMDLRWLNRKGHSLKTIARVSQFNSTVELNYLIPGAHPAREYYSIDTSASKLNQSTGNGENVRLLFAYHNKLHGWRLKAAMNYLIEKYNLSNYPLAGVTFTNNTALLYPSVTLQRTYAKKNILNPDYGYNFTFLTAGGSRYIASRTSFWQFLVNTEFLYTLPTHTRILPRAQFGYTAIDDLSKLPLSMQFYAGSFPSVRGFLFNQIGPGRALAVGSFEAQQRVYGNFYVAGFIDAGLVTDTQTRNTSMPVQPFKNQKFNVGTGPGLVYLSPIGAVEVDVAKVISADEQLAGRVGKWVVQFGLGVLL